MGEEGEEKYNVTLSGLGVRCERIKGTFEEPEDDSESARKSGVHDYKKWRNL